jgi:hypothetical protein
MLLVNNPEAPSPVTAGVVTIVVIAVAFLVRGLLIRIGLESNGVTYAIGAFVLGFLNGGFLVDRLPGGRWAVLGLLIVFSLIIYRLGRLRIFEVLATWATLALAIAPIATLINSSGTSVDQVVAVGEEIEALTFETTPDVVVLLVDGYGSEEVLERFYGYDNSAFLADLDGMGMQVVPNMTSNYGRTKLSVPSFLELGYVPDGTWITGDLERDLLLALGGQNRLADSMRLNGYQTVYVESGWLGTQCAPGTDVCVPGPWPDETVYDIAARSVLRDLPGLETGRSFMRGALQSLDWLEESLSGFLNNGRPDYIYVHVLIPHPPMLLDESCEEDARNELAGFAIGTPGIDESDLSVRRDGYVRQVICVNRHLAEVASEIADANAIGIFTGDHGPDSLAQLFINGDNWTVDQRVERFEVLFGALHEGCDYSDVLSLVNAGRRLLSCLSGTTLAAQPDLHFDLHKDPAGARVVSVEHPVDG